jgi:hypothetical protein
MIMGNITTSITDEQRVLAEKNAKENGGGLRYNIGKLKYNLIPPEWEQGLAHLLTVGSWKYSDRNWENGLAWDDTIAALKRHLNKWLSGENYDPETGSHHLISTAWNALVLFSMQIRGKGKDNVPRPKYVMEVFVKGTLKDPTKPNT